MSGHSFLEYDVSVGGLADFVDSGIISYTASRMVTVASLRRTPQIGSLHGVIPVMMHSAALYSRNYRLCALRIADLTVPRA